MDILTIIILLLATWRVSSLLAKESGPWDIFEKVRTLLGVVWDVESKPEGTNMLSKMIVCIWCNSMWTGTVWILAYFISPLVIWIALPFALSAGAILIECVVGESYGNR
jgi:hypothetical protein